MSTAQDISFLPSPRVQRWYLEQQPLPACRGAQPGLRGLMLRSRFLCHQWGPAGGRCLGPRVLLRSRPALLPPGQVGLCTRSGESLFAEPSSQLVWLAMGWVRSFSGI